MAAPRGSDFRLGRGGDTDERRQSWRGPDPHDAGSNGTGGKRDEDSTHQPIAVRSYACADDIGELLYFLLSFENPYLLGQNIYIDGGTDAIMRPDQISSDLRA